MDNVKSFFSLLKSKSFIIIIILVSFIALALIALWCNQFKNCKAIEKETTIVVKEFSLINNELLCDTFECVTDFARETEYLFHTLMLCNSANKYENFNSFCRSQIDRFASSEVNFEPISKKLLDLARENSDIKRLSTIALNFSSIAKRYIEALVLIANNENEVKSAAILSRCKAEFERDWAETIGSIASFASNKKSLLSPEEKERIKNYVMRYFKDPIEKSFAVSGERGPEAALNLPLGGSWAGVVLYVCIHKK